MSATIVPCAHVGRCDLPHIIQSNLPGGADAAHVAGLRAAEDRQGASRTFPYTCTAGAIPPVMRHQGCRSTEFHATGLRSGSNALAENGRLHHVSCKWLDSRQCRRSAGPQLPYAHQGAGDGRSVSTGPLASSGRWRHSTISRRSSARSGIMIRKFMHCVAAALCCLPVVAIAASDDPKELERLLAKVQSEPLIFVIATGDPNACGRRCTEWIAAEGRSDEGAAQRFRGILAVLAKRDLPIFFNSDGGLVSEAVQIGLILRENRMTAGVARTVPEGDLSFPLDDACRRLMQSKREHKARLYFGGARCGSACVYAMVGASTRHVDPGATLRIHSGTGHEFDKTENFLRRYVIGMGVDPALVDAAAKIPSRSFRGLVEARWNGSVSKSVASTRRRGSPTMDRQEKSFY